MRTLVVVAALAFALLSSRAAQADASGGVLLWWHGSWGHGSWGHGGGHGGGGHGGGHGGGGHRGGHGGGHGGGGTY